MQVPVLPCPPLLVTRARNGIHNQETAVHRAASASVRLRSHVPVSPTLCPGARMRLPPSPRPRASLVRLRCEPGRACACALLSGRGPRRRLRSGAREWGG